MKFKDIDLLIDKILAEIDEIVENVDNAFEDGSEIDDMYNDVYHLYKNEINSIFGIKKEIIQSYLAHGLLNIYSLYYKLFPENIKDMYNIAKMAIKINNQNYFFISAGLKNNINLALDLIKQNGHFLAHVNYTFKDNEDFVIECFKNPKNKHNNVFQHASDRLKSNRNFVKKLKLIDPSAYFPAQMIIY